MKVDIEQLKTKSQSKSPETGISFKIGKDKPQLCGWILEKSDSKPTITGQCTKGLQKEYMGISSNWSWACTKVGNHNTRSYIVNKTLMLD